MARTLINTRQAATLAQVHRRTILRARKSGALKATLINDVWMFRPIDVNRWNNKRTHQK